MLGLESILDAQGVNLDLGKLQVSAVVNDVVYVPLETELLAAARRRGCE